MTISGQGVSSHRLRGHCVEVVIDYTRTMCLRRLRRHDSDYADTLKEQKESDKIKSLGVFAYPITIILTFENFCFLVVVDNVFIGI